MDRSTSLVRDILHEILAASFQRSRFISGLIDQRISRNRSLPSHHRRDLILLIHQAMRWRRRLWGDIAPSKLDLDKTRSLIEEAQALIHNPPYVKWSRLPLDQLSQELSFPTWMIELWIQDQGFESTVNFALSLNGIADTCLRTNTLKIDRDTLMRELDAEGIRTKACHHSPWALKLDHRVNLHATPAFKKGYFEIQDEGSQLTVIKSQVHPKQLVIDACARSGGKSLAMASLMENQGKIIACDIDARVFDELNRRSARAGVNIIQSQWVAKDDPNPLSKFKNSADLVFVDAPCSGMGTLRRKSWMKWSMDASLPREMHDTQVLILKRYAQYVRKGGHLVYVTCTINGFENEKVVRKFIAESEGFPVMEYSASYRPDVEGTDGFFIASFFKTH